MITPVNKTAISFDPTVKNELGDIPWIDMVLGWDSYDIPWGSLTRDFSIVSKTALDFAGTDKGNDTFTATSKGATTFNPTSK